MRISDEHMTLLEQSLDKIENEYRPTCESVSYGSGCPGPTDASLDFWRRAADCVPSMLAEIRERRACDLTSFERLVLETLRDDVAEDKHHDVNIVRVLDKVLAAGGEK